MSVQIRFWAFIKKYQQGDNGSGYWEVPADGQAIGLLLNGLRKRKDMCLLMVI